MIDLQNKIAGAMLGYLQLETAAPIMNNKSSNFFNKNTFTFGENTDEIGEMYEYIIGRLDELKRF